MKPLKTLGLAVVAAAALIALAGIGTASATVLCKNNSSTTACSETYGSGTELKTSLVSGTKSKVATSFKTIECSKSSVAAKTSNAGGSTETIKATVETLTFEECNCTVTVLKKGSFEIHQISGTDNGTFTSTGTEVTTSCSTIFGSVHCLYATSATDLGTLTGGNPAKLSVNVELPRLTTSAICSEQAKWTAEYEVTNPKPLYVAGAGGGGGGGATETTLTTSLSGEEKTGEEITVTEGSKVKDTATLSGTNASKATGTVKYKVYADKECKELVTNAGEVSVSEGKVPASEEKELEAGRVYYWQAEYSGDSNNLKSTSTCGKEVLTVKAKVTLSTSLSGEEKSGEEITVKTGSKVKDTATLSGTNASKATGKVSFKVYADSECKELVAEAGEANAEGGSAGPSEEVELEEGTYHWQATYGGDALHLAATSSCTEVVHVITVATIFRSDATSTTYTGEGEGEKQEVLKTTAGTISCEKVTYSGSQSGDEASDFEVEATYSGCTAFGSPAEVKANGCKYRYTAGTYEEGKLSGSMDIVCPEGKEIVATGSTCTVDIPAQNGLTTVTYTNTAGPPTDITAAVSLSGVKYTQAGSGSCATATDENGTREGTDIFRGETERESKVEEVGVAADLVGTHMTISPVRWAPATVAGLRKGFTLKNDHLIKRYLTIDVVNINEEVKEEDFEIVAKNTEPCGTMNSTEECEVTVEFKSGALPAAPSTRWLRVTWGGWWPWSTKHKRKVDLIG